VTVDPFDPSSYSDCGIICDLFAALGQGNPMGGFGGVYLYP
jgi:hypothetical protein